MPLSPGLAQWLSNRGHDALHVTHLRLDRAADAEIMARAAAEARVIITADLDYPRLLAIAGASGPSLILFRGGDWSDNEIIERTRQLLDSVTEAELGASIVVVERHRVRKRRLPIA